MATIMVVEDDPGMRNLVYQALSFSGHEVILMNNVDDAVMFLSIQAVDLLITDIVMPERDGLELLMQLREMHSPTPAIAVSGGGWLGEKTYLRTARGLGCRGTLGKPFKIATLLSTVNTVLSGGVLYEDAGCEPSIH